MSSENLEKLNEVQNQLGEIGRILLASPTPWLHEQERIIPFRFRWYFPDDEELSRGNLMPVLDGDAVFGLFCIMATTIEAEVGNELEERTAFCKHFSEILERASAQEDPLSPLDNLLLTRFQFTDYEKIEAALNRFSFSTNQINFIWSWIRQEMHLVQQRGSKKRRRKLAE